MLKKKSLFIQMVFTLIIVLVLVQMTPSYVYANANTNVSDWINKKNQEGTKTDTTPAVDKAKSETAAVGVSFWDFLRTILALAFVIGLLYALLKFVNKRNLKYQQNQIIQNLGGLSLGAQKSVQLVQVGETLLVIGVGENINVLMEITDQTQIDKLLEIYQEKQELAASVPHIVEILGKWRKGTSQDSNQQNEQTNFSELLQKKISGIKQQRSKEIEKWKKENDD